MSSFPRRSAPLGRTTSYVYDANGNKTSETDANNHTTTYQYDALNRLTLTTYPDNTTTKYTYDFRNNVIDATDQLGRVTHNVYDLAGRSTSATTANGTEILCSTREESNRKMPLPNYARTNRGGGPTA